MSPASTLTFVVLVVAAVAWWCGAAWWAARLAERAGARRPPAGGPRRPSPAAAAARTALVLAAWLAFTAWLAASGVLLDVDARPPAFLRLMLPAFAATVALAWTPWASRLVDNLPIGALVGFQAFRIPLELWLHRAYVEGVIPVQMTYAGLNFDIVSGVTAGAVGLWASRAGLPRWVVGAWNLLGFVLLCVIVTIAVLSAPGPLRQFMGEPANAIVLTAPFVWLPTVLVLTALLGHLLVFRAWRGDRRGHIRG